MERRTADSRPEQETLFSPAEMGPTKDEANQRHLLGGYVVMNSGPAPIAERTFQLPDDFEESERTQDRANRGTRSPMADA